MQHTRSTFSVQWNIQVQRNVSKLFSLFLARALEVSGFLPYYIDVGGWEPLERMNGTMTKTAAEKLSNRLVATSDILRVSTVWTNGHPLDNGAPYHFSAEHRDHGRVVVTVGDTIHASVVPELRGKVSFEWADTTN